MSDTNSPAPFVLCRMCEQPIDLETALPAAIEELTGPFSVNCPHCGAQSAYTAADILGGAAAF
jgi:hypothetical protein